MNTRVTSVQIMFDDKRVSTRYALVDADGKVVSRSDAVRDTVLSDALAAQVLAETQAQVEADVAAFVAQVPQAAAQPDVITDAMLQLGRLQTQIEQTRAAAAQLDAQLAEKQASLATIDTAQAKPGIQ